VAERVLTLVELNRATLARQLLLERRRIGAVRAVERLAGMQAQWPPSPYIGLWSRSVRFRPDSLELAVRAGEIIKPTLMRGTLHLVSTRDYPMLYAALRDMPTWYGDSHLAVALRHVDAVRSLAPITHNEGLAYLERAGIEDDVDRRRTFHAVRRRAHLLHTPDSALWRGRPQGLFYAQAVPESIDVVPARTELVRRYLGAFGPGSRADIASWSGLRVADVAGAIDALEPLRRFRAESGRELLDLPRAPLPPAETPAPVRFLPKWDNTLFAHADRARVLPDELRKAVVAADGDVTQVFLVGGFAAGSWSYDKRGKVTTVPFAPLPRAARRAVDDEAALLGAWLAA
jgi:hypothetical protein